ncbi:MAG: amidohydrolase, partial [Massilia sp.]|nr:amidohydrolase [Massilia sp.]
EAPAASVAFCATAGLRSGREGICPAVKLREAGVTVALGTDNVAANNSYDMIAEMRVAGLVASHRERRAQPISSQDLLRMATIEGAKALGLDHEIGSLETGKAADIVAVDIRGTGYSETPDPETLLIYSGSGRDVAHVWVAGQPIVRDKQLVLRDLAEIRQSYSQTYAAFWDRVAQARKAA